jgi:hypothetical protein
MESGLSSETVDESPRKGRNFHATWDEIAGSEGLSWSMMAENESRGLENDWCV